MKLLISVALLTLSIAHLPAWGGDLSRYRIFTFGSSLAAVSKQSGVSLAQVKVLHSRPALIQELAWRPQPSNSQSRSDSAQEVVFSFYKGELFHIVVTYGRYETEGLTTKDIVGSISRSFGMAAESTSGMKPGQSPYSDHEESLAHWADAQYSFDLLRSPFGPTYKLIGSQKQLEALAQTAIAESARLDTIEAPQRKADQAAREDEVERVKLEKARLVNKPNFRP